MINLRPPHSYMPSVCNCSSEYAPRCWTSLAGPFPAPLMMTYSSCEFAAVHTWHSKLALHSGQVPLVSWPQYRWKRDPVTQAPAKREQDIVTDCHCSWSRNAFSLKNKKKIGVLFNHGDTTHHHLIPDWCIWCTEIYFPLCRRHW